MLETKQDKMYFVISLVVVVVLLSITIFQKTNFQYKDTTDYAAKQKQAQLLADAYNKYLASIQTDPVASQELFQTILTQDDIRKEVEDEFNTGQTINLPQVADTDLNITKASGQKAVTDYLTAAMGPLVHFSQNTAELNKSLFADSNTSQSVTQAYNQAFKKLMAAPVPKEALATQKALVAAYTSYGKFLDISQKYTSQQNQQPWADTYQQYAAMNKSFASFIQSYNQLVNKYNLAYAVLVIPEDSAKGYALIPKAQALFGLGDMTVTVSDIPRMIMDEVQQGLTSSFSQFMATFLDKMVQKIESNYMVANFLYYSDALVSGQYTDDYLNKYVSDQLDRRIIKQFIPQFSCNKNNASLKPIFDAKASQRLGFDPSVLDPKDPDYYKKLASVGDLLNSSEGEQMYYEDLADQTENAAQQAVTRELTSSGLKTPRDALTGGITTSINTIVSGEKASLEAVLQLGINTASSFVSQFVAQISQTLFTKFVFSGVTTSLRSPNSIGVLKEQTTCLAAAQLAPIVPITGTQYQQPPPAPSTQSLINQACANVPGGCNTVTPTKP